MTKIAFVLKGYPRLSETFIAQEICGLEKRGLKIEIISLRPPRDKTLHPVHKEIVAPVCYLPERLRDQPMRLLSALTKETRKGTLLAAWRLFVRDWRLAPSRDLIRRFGQGIILASELAPDIAHLHAHFLHTPASVTRYASLISGLPWTCSAHARDIWTTPDNEKRSKLAHMQWLVTCTDSGRQHLAELAPDPRKVSLLYHGLDLKRFAGPRRSAHARNGGLTDKPVQMLSVGRAVAKKGFDILIEALALLPPDLSWHWTHIGSGDQLNGLQRLANEHGLGQRISWQGTMTQQDVLNHYRVADIFVLPCRIADDGDRDGMPNVLMEAMSQELPCISTCVSGIPELIDNGTNGMLIAPDNADALSNALIDLIRDPGRRTTLGVAARKKITTAFNCDAGLDQLAARFMTTLTATTKTGEH